MIELMYGGWDELGEDSMTRKHQRYHATALPAPSASARVVGIASSRGATSVRRSHSSFLPFQKLFQSSSCASRTERSILLTGGSSSRSRQFFFVSARNSRIGGPPHRVVGHTIPATCPRFPPAGMSRPTSDSIGRQVRSPPLDHRPLTEPSTSGPTTTAIIPSRSLTSVNHLPQGHGHSNSQPMILPGSPSRRNTTIAVSRSSSPSRHNFASPGGHRGSASAVSMRSKHHWDDKDLQE